MSNSPPLLHLNLFGRPSLRAQGKEVLGPGKPIFLLGYLACQPRRRGSRSRAVELLWGDVPSARGRQTLRQTILQLRRRLGAEVVAADGDDLILTDVVRVDRDQFLKAFATESWGEAARLAAAPLLHDAAAPGCALFERWIDHDRTRCRELVETAVIAASADYARAGANDHAIALATRWRDADPAHEPAWQRVLTTVLELGEPSLARLEARACMAALAQLGVPPSPVTRELIGRADATLMPPGSHDRAPLCDPELVGRNELFASLIEAQRLACHGRLRRVLLTGGSGLGKSQLLRSVGDWIASADEMDVTIIAAARPNAAVSAGALSELLLALGGHRSAVGISTASARALVAVAPDLAERFPGCLPVTNWEPLQSEVVQALQELLVVLTEERAQALLLDDLHWWDPLSEAVLAAALAGCADLRLLVIATSQQPQPAFLADESHVLAPLTVDDVVQLLESVGDADRTTLTLVAPPIHRWAGGVPLLVLEAMRWLMDRRALVLQGTEWRLLDPVVASGLNRQMPLIEERIAALPASAVQIVRALAIAEQRLPRRVLPGTALDPRLLDGGFVTIKDDLLTLRHEMIGTRAVAFETPATIRTIREELARSILAVDSLPTWQLRLAGQLAVRAEHRELAGVAFQRWAVVQRALHPISREAWAAFLGAPVASVTALAPRGRETHAARRIWDKLVGEA